MRKQGIKADTPELRKEYGFGDITNEELETQFEIAKSYFEKHPRATKAGRGKDDLHDPSKKLGLNKLTFSFYKDPETQEICCAAHDKKSGTIGRGASGSVKFIITKDYEIRVKKAIITNMVRPAAMKFIDLIKFYKHRLNKEDNNWYLDGKYIKDESLMERLIDDYKKKYLQTNSSQSAVETQKMIAKEKELGIDIELQYGSMDTEKENKTAQKKTQLILEYRGKTFDNLLKDRTTLTEKKQIEMAKLVCRSYRKLHEGQLSKSKKAIFHSDIKSANYAEKGLIDLGFGDYYDKNNTQHFVPKGTPYMMPIHSEAQYLNDPKEPSNTRKRMEKLGPLGSDIVAIKKFLYMNKTQCADETTRQKLSIFDDNLYQKLPEKIKDILDTDLSTPAGSFLLDRIEKEKHTAALLEALLICYEQGIINNDKLELVCKETWRQGFITSGIDENEALDSEAKKNLIHMITEKETSEEEIQQKIHVHTPYSVTPEQILKCDNPNWRNPPAQGVGGNFVVTMQNYPAENKNKSGIARLALDCFRGVEIVGLDVKSSKDNTETIREALNKNEIWKEKSELIEKHYCQAPWQMALEAMQQTLGNSVYSIKSEPITKLYVEQGKVFLKQDLKSITIVNAEHGSEKKLDCDLNILYQLTDQGFVLQPIKTSSDIVHDLMLATPLATLIVERNNEIDKLLDDGTFRSGYEKCKRNIEGVLKRGRTYPLCDELLKDLANNFCSIKNQNDLEKVSALFGNVDHVLTEYINNADLLCNKLVAISTTYLNHLDKSDSPEANKKKTLITQAIGILSDNKKDSGDKITQFKNYISDNKDALSVRRDSGLVRFFKSVALAFATVAGFYKSSKKALFGKETTAGGLFVKNTDTLISNQMKMKENLTQIKTEQKNNANPQPKSIQSNFVP